MTSGTTPAPSQLVPLTASMGVASGINATTDGVPAPVSRGRLRPWGPLPEQPHPATGYAGGWPTLPRWRKYRSRSARRPGLRGRSAAPRTPDIYHCRSGRSRYLTVDSCSIPVPSTNTAITVRHGQRATSVAAHIDDQPVAAAQDRERPEDIVGGDRDVIEPVDAEQSAAIVEPLHAADEAPASLDDIGRPQR